MKNVYNTALLLIAFLLSANVNAEGQEVFVSKLVTIPAKSESYLKDVRQIAHNDEWLVHTYSSWYMAKNTVGQEFKLFTWNGGMYPVGLPWNMSITKDDLLIVDTARDLGNTVAVFDLNNILPEIERWDGEGEGRIVHPQNWDVTDNQTPGFGNWWFVDESRNRLGVSDDNRIQIFEIFGNKNPVQEIFPNLESSIVRLTGTGDFFAVSDGHTVFLYRHNGTEYVEVAKYTSIYNPNWKTSYGNRMSLSFSASGELLLMVTGDYIAEVRMIDPITLMVEDQYALDGTGQDGEKPLGLLTLISVSGEYAVIAWSKILEIPTGAIIAEFSNHNNGNAYDGYADDLDASIEVIDNRIIRMYVSEVIGNDSWIRYYEAPLFEPRLQITPTAPWGAVTQIGQKRGLKESILTFSATAGKNRMLKNVIVGASDNGEVVPGSRKVGGIIFDVVVNDVNPSIRASFTKAGAKIQAQAKVVITGEPVWIAGLKKTGLTVHQLLPGDYIGYDGDFLFQYEIHVPKSGKVKVNKTKMPGFLWIK